MNGYDGENLNLAFNKAKFTIKDCGGACLSSGDKQDVGGLYGVHTYGHQEEDAYVMCSLKMGTMRWKQEEAFQVLTEKPIKERSVEKEAMQECRLEGSKEKQIAAVKF